MDQAAGSPVFSAQPEGQPLRLSWVQPAGLVALSFANFILRILTLGIYNFWGKTEIRRRVWSAVRVDGEPLSYTGTGKELFLGFLIILAIIFIPTTLLSFAVIYFFGPQSPMLVVFQLLISVFFFYLTGVAIYRAQRYRLSRTNWRGIRGSLVGSDLAYAWKYFWTGLLVSMTWGWIIPWRATSLQESITRDMRFGDRSFHFNGESGPLYGPFAVFWCGAAVIIVIAIAAMAGGAAAMFGVGALEAGDTQNPPNPMQILKILGLIYGVSAIAFLFYYLLSAWYRARQVNHFAKHTHFGTASFRSSVTGGGLVWNALGNFMLRMAGLLLGVLILAAVIGIAGLIWGPDGANALKPGAGELPGGLVQAAIFGGIVLLAASAGLFGPIIQARTARYLVENLSIDGLVPLDQIAQGADQGIRRGEGLAQAFDVDAF